MILKFKNKIFSNYNKPIVVDSDLYEMLWDKEYRLEERQDVLFRTSKGKKVPLWRLARRCFDKRFTIEYKDGNKFNVQRTNLILKKA